jgi:MFS family permease
VTGGRTGGRTGAALRHTFRSLSVRNFRLFAAGQLVSVAGTWIMFVAQDWLVLSLSHDSGTALGAVTALQFAPLLLTPLGGGLADRYDKRALLVLANAASGVLALGFGALVWGGSVRLWHIALFALGLGVVNAVEVPARLAFVSEMVGSELLPNASALSAAYFNVARTAGPALAGGLIAWLGTGPVVLLNAVSYLGTVTALLMMRPEELRRAPRAVTDRRVSDGLRHMVAARDLALPMALVAVVCLAGFNFQLTLPLLAKTVFHSDPASFGLLTAVFAAGSLLGALLTTARRGRPRERVVIGAALALGGTECLSGLAPTYASAAALLFLTGTAAISFAQAANHRIQLGTEPAYRGRVMALYALISQGTTPLGALAVGRLTDGLGARAGLWAGGLVCLAAGLAALAVRARRGPARRDVPREDEVVRYGTSSCQ